MLAWVVGAPILFGVLLLMLARLEERLVAPIDRADRITKLIETSDPDVLEDAVAEFLSPVVLPRRVRSAAATGTTDGSLPGMRRRLL